MAPFYSLLAWGHIGCWDVAMKITVAKAFKFVSPYFFQLGTQSFLTIGTLLYIEHGCRQGQCVTKRG